MSIRIQAYDPKYLQQHVELGRRMTRSWKYFGQTSYEVMQQQYARPDFDPQTRRYALLGDELKGFQTADIIDAGFARMEFPIVDNDYPELVDMLYRDMLGVLREKTVKKIQTRVSPFWGNTHEYAQTYGFTHDRDLYYVTEYNIVDPPFDPGDPGKLQLQKYDRTRHRQGAKRILMEVFDSSSDLANSYLEAYADPPESVVLHKYQTHEDRINVRITLTVVEQEKKIRGYGTLYLQEGYAHDVEAALGIIQESCMQNKVDQIQLYLAGLNKKQYSKYIDPDRFDTVISFYSKDLN